MSRENSVVQPVRPAWPELLDVEQAAVYIGLQKHTLDVWRSSGRYGLPFIKVGRRVKYRRQDLDHFLEQRTVGALAAGGS
jgi:excisionase family DNA binding protein